MNSNYLKASRITHHASRITHHALLITHYASRFGDQMMSKKKRSVLCIDDEEIIRITIGDFLEDSGYLIYEAENGENGLEKFRKNRPDIVLVDLSMPDIDGLEVLSEVVKESPETPVIVISGTGILHDAIEALRLGAWNYITKPIRDLAVLEFAVRQAIEKADLIRETRFYKENLEKMVQQRTRELEDAHTQLRQAQKMEAIGTLAGGIAHDFNNTLGAITGYTQLTLYKLPKESPLRNYLDQVLNASYRAKDLVDQILTFSRRREKAERIPVQIAAIVKEDLKMLRAPIPSTIEIRQDIEDDTGTIEADPTQIHQVIMNLCTNAAHAMEKSGGVLEVSMTRTDFDEQEASLHPDLKPGSFVKLTVKDTGHGIPSGIMDRVFDPYFTTKEPGEGTGLGLAVVHGIIKSHEGAISVESSPGKGTTFHVYFPGTSEIKKSQEVKTVDEPSLGRHEYVLFIDDDKVLAYMGQKALEHIGYKVDTRTDSIEALEVFRKTPDLFDLVITDLTMPGLTGEDLALEMMKIRPDIPVILCTGYSERISDESAVATGVRRLLLKPLELNNLAKVIREVLDKKNET
ncbi:response regulator [Desulfococcaceae bacterium HSG8]|nr:response regulator [Desulfococcaceae bacterium HSG8]